MGLSMSLFYRSALRVRLIGILVFILGLASATTLASAQSNSAIAQQFQTQDTRITAASLVSFKKDDPNSVELSEQKETNRLLGVVSNKPLIELSEGGTGVQVVTSGTTFALVSDINGPVLTGDKITVSPIIGVGMRATESTVIVGTAQGSLASVSTETRELTDQNGRKQKVKIGLLAVQIGVAAYVAESQSQSSFVPPFLQSIANNVSGRNVSPIRVLIAALLLLLTFISIVALLYSSVRSSIISIGRNPLSEVAVRKSLYQVAITVITVLLFAVIVIYLILMA